MTRWSGLAPAVDAHLKRWSQSREGEQMAERLVNEQGRNAATLRQAWRGLPHLRNWLHFGLSYGVTGPNGEALVTYTTLTPNGQAMEVALRVADGQTITGREKYEGHEHELVQGALLAVREAEMLAKATSHYVSDAVVQEVTVAASLAEPEPLHETDLFCPSGFAVLERPFLMTDLDIDTGAPRDDLRVAVRAIGWHAHGGIINLREGRMSRGVTLFLYSTAEDHNTWYAQDFVRAYPDRGEASIPDEGGPFFPLDVIPWSFGVEWNSSGGSGEAWEPGCIPTPVGYARRWFMAFQRLCWQTVIVHHRDRMPSRDVRRWDRMAQRKPILDYTVLRLRRDDDPGPRNETGFGAPLAYRVRTRGHWRRVHVKSLGPARLPGGAMDPATHRLLWIEPYWRGPEDGPLGPMSSATVVVR